MGKIVITSDHVRLARQGGHTSIAVPAGALITSQARDDALAAHITFVTEENSPAAPAVAAPAKAAPPQVPAWAAVPVTTLPSPAASAQPVSGGGTGVQPGQASPAGAQLATGFELANRLPGAAGFTVADAAPGLVGFSLANAAQNVSSATLPRQEIAMQQPMNVSSFAVPPVVVPAVPESAQPAPVQLNRDAEDLYAEVRRQVLSRLPAGADAAQVDEMIRQAFTQKGPGACGGSCVTCARASAPVPSAPNSGDGVWLERAGSAVRVNSRALTFSQTGNGVGMMQVLAPRQGSQSPSAGYVQWESGAFSWTFPHDEVVVMLEGEMRVSAGGASFMASAGDVCAFAAGTQATFEARGRVRYVSVAPTVRG